MQGDQKNPILLIAVFVILSGIMSMFSWIIGYSMREALIKELSSKEEEGVRR